MRIAVTSQNRIAVTSHAGRCRRFWIFNVEGDQIVDRDLVELSKEQTFHESKGSSLPPPLGEINVMITGGMGRGLVTRLERGGVKGIVTDQQDPEKAVKAFLDGTLSVTSPLDHQHKAGCPSGGGRRPANPE